MKSVNTLSTVPDPAVIRAVTKLLQPANCSLLATLLPAESAEFKPGRRLQKTGQGDGKFGHIPSARLVRTGYKQSKMLGKLRGETVTELFLEDKEYYRSKQIKDAAKLIRNIVQGKTAEVTGDTLRELKMRRVEHFLKDKLGVQKGNEKMKEVCDSNDGKREDVYEANGENIQELGGNVKQAGDKMKYTQVKDLKCSKTDVTDEEVCKDVSTDVVVKDSAVSKGDERKEVSKKSKLMKREAARRKLDTEALILPAPFINEAKVDEVPLADIQSDHENKTLTPDLIGLYPLSLPVSPSSDLTLLSSLQEDITWFDTPVSLRCIENKTGAAMLEVKLSDKDMATAVLLGLKHKYPGLEGDMTGAHFVMFPDKVTGLYTLCFTDTKMKRYKATIEQFKHYSKQLPIISRGLGVNQVMVGFHAKGEAVEALRANLDNEEFPELQVASGSRG